MARLSSDELRKIIGEKYRDKRLLPELIFGIRVHSKTKVSLWLAGKYSGDNESLERDIRSFLSRSQLSRSDERRLADIVHILNYADNRDAIIAKITASAE